MAEKFDWKKYPFPKLILEKGIEEMIKENNGEITLDEVMKEASDQAHLIVCMFRNENKLLTDSPPEHTTLNWIYNPKLVKQLLAHTVPA